MHLPSLRSLRYFEVAARLGGFTAAAEELDVSQSAISHRIRILEEQVGYKLFHRSKRGVTLTDQGEFYYHEVSKAFDRIVVATNRLTPSVGASSINLTVTPLISSRWLIPRMQDFNAKYSGVHLNLSHSEDRISPATVKGAIEDQVVISYRRRVPPNWTQELLFSAGMVPLCNPSLLPKGATELEPHQLLEMPILHEKDRGWWTDWFRMSGVTEDLIPAGSVMDAPMSLIESALNGQAVVLAPPALFQEHIDAGLLVMPAGNLVRIPIDYYLMRPEKISSSSGVRKFVKWVRKQASDARFSSELYQ